MFGRYTRQTKNTEVAKAVNIADTNNRNAHAPIFNWRRPRGIKPTPHKG